MQSYLIQRLLGTIDRATYTWWQMFLEFFNPIFAHNHLANSAQISEISAIRASRIDVNQPYLLNIRQLKLISPKEPRSWPKSAWGQKQTLRLGFRLSAVPPRKRTFDGGPSMSARCLTHFKQDRGVVGIAHEAQPPKVGDDLSQER